MVDINFTDTHTIGDIVADLNHTAAAAEGVGALLLALSDINPESPLSTQLAALAFLADSIYNKVADAAGVLGRIAEAAQS